MPINLKKKINALVLNRIEAATVSDRIRFRHHVGPFDGFVNLTNLEWALILHLLLPDRYTDPIDAAVIPTDTAPSTQERVEIYRKRCESRLPLFCSNDASPTADDERESRVSRLALRGQLTKNNVTQIVGWKDE